MSALAIALAKEAPSRAAGACPPARFDGTMDELPAAWRAAMEALIVATAVEGQPWACGGARLTLQVDLEGSAELVVEDAQGRSVRRSVPGPADLVSMGEALLAAPLVEPAIVAPAASRAAPAPDRSASHAAAKPPPSAIPTTPPATPPHEPRIYLDVLASGRYTGPTRAVWPGGVLRLTLPFDAWSAGVWARFDAPAAVLDRQPDDFTMTEVSVGAVVDRRILAAPFELRVGFEPSIAVMSMVGGEEPELHDGAKADPRLGLALRGVWPLSRAFRLLGSIDAEVAPAAAGPHKSRLIDPELPEVPSFTVGISVGAGVGLL